MGGLADLRFQWQPPEGADPDDVEFVDALQERNAKSFAGLLDDS